MASVFVHIFLFQNSRIFHCTVWLIDKRKPIWCASFHNQVFCTLIMSPCFLRVFKKLLLAYLSIYLFIFSVVIYLFYPLIHLYMYFSVYYTYRNQKLIFLHLCAWSSTVSTLPLAIPEFGSSSYHIIQTVFFGYCINSFKWELNNLLVSPGFELTTFWSGIYHLAVKASAQPTEPSPQLLLYYIILHYIT